MNRPSRLSLEQLESRDTPAAFGVPWADPQHITVSFVADGTDVSGVASTLFSKMQADGLSATQVRTETLRALQAWAGAANLNVGLVADSGDAVGASGLGQGDSRFGDIRVSMRSLGSNFLAITTPPSGAAGTLAGDIVLNSDYRFSIGGNGGTGSYDLYTVLLQEGGHAFGLDNSAETGSAMYEWWQGARAGLGTGDAASLQALYGARAADSFESNNALGSAKVVPAVAGTSTLYAVADVGGQADMDYFKFTVPAGQSGPVSVKVRTAGVSLLAANATLINAAGQGMAYANAGGPGQDLTLTANLAPNQTYYVSVRSMPGSAFTAGAYKLSVVFNSSAADPALAPSSAPPPLAIGENQETGTLNGTLEDDLGYTYTSLGISQPTFLKMDFYALAQGANPPTGVHINVFSRSTGALVASFDELLGQRSVRTVFLQAGEYDFVFNTVGGSGAVDYTFKVDALSDPVGITNPNPGSIDSPYFSTPGRWFDDPAWEGFYNWAIKRKFETMPWYFGLGGR
ncbi:MAG: matrixin family metalloprotease [Gemmataceae bacterium]|nr:matrixin family metalloprotease [Gemmataceae bacterium]